jgi:hypothetical protein
MHILFFSRDYGSIQTTIPLILYFIKKDVRISVISFSVSGEFYRQYGIPFETIGYGVEDPGLNGWIDEKLDQLRPDIVVSGSSPRKKESVLTPEQMMITAARRRCIPSLGILDYWGMYRERFHGTDGRLNPDLIPDRLCVLDQLCYNNLIDLGLPGDRMTITNNPWMDGLAADSDDYIAIRSRTDGARDLSVLFISQPLEENAVTGNYDWTQYDLFQALLRSLGSHRHSGRNILVVWLHPDENPVKWEQVISDYDSGSNWEIIIEQERTKRRIANADFIVTSHSTLVYNALYYGTPCVSLRFNTRSVQEHVLDRLNLIEIIEGETGLDNAVGRRGKEDWEKIRRDILEKKKRMSRDGVFFSDGKATDRVVREIESIVGKGTR